MMLPGQLDAFVARFGCVDFQRLFLEQAPEGIVDVLLIVDDEDGLALIEDSI
jgi:hypothetical protein